MWVLSTNICYITNWAWYILKYLFIWFSGRPERGHLLRITALWEVECVWKNQNQLFSSALINHPQLDREHKNVCCSSSWAFLEIKHPNFCFPYAPPLFHTEKKATTFAYCPVSLVPKKLARSFVQHLQFTLILFYASTLCLCAYVSETWKVIFSLMFDFRVSIRKTLRKPALIESIK